MGKRFKRKQRAADGTRSPGVAGTVNFTAPTSGLEDVFFTWGTAKDAAKFEDTVSKLARHVGTSPWPQSSVASKAMSTLKSPEFQEPTIPTREYWKDPEQTIKTKDKTRPGPESTVVNNVPVLEDWERGLGVEQYKADRKVYSEQVMAWKENKAKCYYLVLSHCPRALEHQLKNSTKWDETESNQDVVALLQMIRDITHNKKERKESVMAIVESDLELYTIAHDPGESLDEYYKAFLAQVDTIDAHGGNAGYHLAIYSAHKEAKLQKMGKTREECDAMDEEAREAI